MALVDDTMGCLLMGAITAGMLWGVSCSQVYYYYTHYQKDSIRIKLLVAAVWACDSAHQALITQSVYDYLITSYGDPQAVFLPNKGLIVEVFFNGLTGLFVQSFFVHRIWMLSNKKIYLTLPVAALVLCEFAVTAAYATRAFSVATFLQLSKLKTLSISMNAFAAAGDVAIAAILCTILHTSRTKFSRSNALINRLMVFAVNTGLLTSICAVLSLITFFTCPNTFVYIVFYYLIGRLYSNSFMATLNARKGFHQSSSGADISLSLRDTQPHAQANTYTLTQRHDGIAIRIDTTKDTRGGGDMDHEYHQFDVAHDKRPMADSV